MMVEKIQSGIAAQLKVAQHAVGAEHAFGVGAPGANQLTLHALVLAFADRLPDMAFDQPPAAKMVVIAPREGGAAKHHRIDLAAVDAGDPQAFVDRLGRHPAAVGLAPREAFEGYSRAHAVFVEHAGPSVVIARMNAKNYHCPEPVSELCPSVNCALQWGRATNPG